MVDVGEDADLGGVSTSCVEVMVMVWCKVLTLRMPSACCCSCTSWSGAMVGMAGGLLEIAGRGGGVGVVVAAAEGGGVAEEVVSQALVGFRNVRFATKSASPTTGEEDVTANAAKRRQTANYASTLIGPFPFTTLSRLLESLRASPANQRVPQR